MYPFYVIDLTQCFLKTSFCVQAYVSSRSFHSTRIADCLKHTDCKACSQCAECSALCIHYFLVLRNQAGVNMEGCPHMAHVDEAVTGVSHALIEDGEPLGHSVVVAGVLIS